MARVEIFFRRVVFEGHYPLVRVNINVQRLASVLHRVVGEVVKCEKHPNADKLLVSQINVGDETKQIVSGIADAYKPEDFVGTKVIVVNNLKPAKLRGVESQGMILAGGKGKKLKVATADLPVGTIIH